MTHKKDSSKPPVPIPFPFNLIPRVFPWLEKFATPLANRLTVLLFFSPLRFKTPKKEQEAAEQSKSVVLTVSGKKIQAYLWGEEGPTILMSHGWSGRGTQFRKFVQPFTEAGLRVLAFDGPAHGKSQGRQTHIVDFYDVISVLNQRFGPFKAMIGHSFGGVVNTYALINGVSTDKMIMISSPTIGQDVIDDAIKKMNGSPERGEYLKKYVIRKYNVDFDDLSILKMIEDVTDTPLLLIHDRNDKEVPLKHPNSLLAKYPKARLIETEGLGHIRILKSPQVVKYALDFILDKN